ncbi:MAG: ribosome recycling factor [Cellvibrionales bacterium TMED49]|nr:MAG: ribosome recycling factor [Cellvibrionales bacterium TMED49]
MIKTLEDEATSRMHKALDALAMSFSRIRTGRAHPKLLDGITIDYFGTETPLSQASSISVEDARTLSVTPWDRSLVTDIEKAIMRSNLGLNPSTSGMVIRIPLPALTEETRKIYTKQAKSEAEQSRISIRSIRRDVISKLKSLQKASAITEDDERKGQDAVQKVTDLYISKVEQLLVSKARDLMEV